jgi:hypothetical protein
VRQDFEALLFRKRLLGESRQQVGIRVISGVDRTQARTHDIGQFIHDSSYAIRASGLRGLLLSGFRCIYFEN